MAQVYSLAPNQNQNGMLYPTVNSNSQIAPINNMMGQFPNQQGPFPVMYQNAEMNQQVMNIVQNSNEPSSYKFLVQSKILTCSKCIKKLLARIFPWCFGKWKGCCRVLCYDKKHKLYNVKLDKGNEDEDLDPESDTKVVLSSYCIFYSHKLIIYNSNETFGKGNIVISKEYSLCDEEYNVTLNEKTQIGKIVVWNCVCCDWCKISCPCCDCNFCCCCKERFVKFFKIVTASNKVYYIGFKKNCFFNLIQSFKFFLSNLSLCFSCYRNYGVQVFDSDLNPIGLVSIKQHKCTHSGWFPIALLSRCIPTKYEISIGNFTNDWEDRLMLSSSLVFLAARFNFYGIPLEKRNGCY